MAKPRKRRPVLWILGTPAAILAVAFAWVADNPLAAGIVGALVGLFIGIALLGFPNLDRGGPSDTGDMLR